MDMPRALRERLHHPTPRPGHMGWPCGRPGQGVVAAKDADTDHCCYHKHNVQAADLRCPGYCRDPAALTHIPNYHYFCGALRWPPRLSLYLPPRHLHLRDDERTGPSARA